MKRYNCINIVPQFKLHNDNIYNEDNSTNRPLNEEEQIDIALSKIYEVKYE
ncbi:hypothetical protein PFFCH_02458 [Plasmodium falciparum FCH/4]|uniref:Uncharacterized protein n=1 Tax=Plasmodium falciparum FCH/4 TaxID=1036724 RepID=A0A024VNS8_PLAFA|nr:hypothetical protein PFFCH_02458 [Plasmodium falciparum FCH/4]